MPEMLSCFNMMQHALEAGRAIMRIYNDPDADWEVERKADNSPLTIADRRAHYIIKEGLRYTPYPMTSEEGDKDPYWMRRAWDVYWLVDPLDGTKEFLKRNGEFTVNIAQIADGRPFEGCVYAPALGVVYYGREGYGAWRATVDPETLELGERIPLPIAGATENRPFRVVASRSHLSPETEQYINTLRADHPDLELVSAGSSLKLCRVAEGSADVYPRLAPTMEWDTAAGDAICRAVGCSVVDFETGQPLLYNKEDLHNPHFLVTRG